jgi:hypothetical protein
METLEHLTGKSRKKDYLAWKEKVKGSILAMVAR